VPAGKMLNLVKLKTGTRITFAGRTTFGYAEKREDQIQIGGRDIVVEGAPGHIIDGNGPQHWDGGGSNTGRTK
jgi:polygalacturonase